MYGSVETPDQEVIIQVSTREKHIRESLYGTNTVSAAKNVGQILSQRLEESGIHTAVFDREGAKFHGMLVKQESGWQNGEVWGGGKVCL